MNTTNNFNAPITNAVIGNNNSQNLYSEIKSLAISIEQNQLFIDQINVAKKEADADKKEGKV